MKCTNITSYFYLNVNIYFLVGTACAPGGVCTLLVSFHGHSVRSWRRLYPPCFFSWAQRALLAAAVPSLFLFMGTACAPGGVCALLVPFRGHSMGLRRCLCPPCFFSWAQRVLATVAVPSPDSLRHRQHISIKKQCPDHIFPDPGTVLYNLRNILSLRRWHDRCTAGNICPSER